MARIRNPVFSNCSMMSPIAFLRTASGLTIVRVRCKVFILSLVLGRSSLFVETLLATSLATRGLYLGGEKRRSKLRLYAFKRLLLSPPPAFLQWRLETSKRGFRKLPAP